METVHTIDDVRARVRNWKQAGLRVGFVPTMGNLHQGHLALVTAALEKCDRVVASIFVNPTQFGPNEDFDSYPRTMEVDQQKLEHAGTDLLFAPSVEVMYPSGEKQTVVSTPELGQYLCGASRPGHFDGVTTVVSKLFNIVEPDLAAFGEKDYQQLAIIRKMARDLCFAVEILGVATVREADGLAMSSRNGYLSESERLLAPQIQQTLQGLAQQLEQGNKDFRELEQTAGSALAAAGFTVDYLAIVQADSLTPAQPEDRDLLVAVAAKLGQTRLIDNIPVNVVCDQ